MIFKSIICKILPFLVTSDIIAVKGNSQPILNIVSEYGDMRAANFGAPIYIPRQNRKFKGYDRENRRYNSFNKKKR